MADHTHRIVEVLERSDLKRVWVASHQAAKLLVRTVHGRQEKCAEKNVIIVHEGDVAERDHVERMQALSAEVAAVRATVDLELVWEFVKEAPREYALGELTELLFGDTSVGRSALVEALLEDGVFFKRRGHVFDPRSQEQVDELRISVVRRVEKETERAVIGSWLEQLFNGKSPPAGELLPAVLPVAEQCRALLYQQVAGEHLRWLDTVRPDLDPRETAVEVLRRIGWIPADEDPFLALAGIVSVFPAPVEAAARALAPARLDLGDREEHRDALTFSIDDEDTREIDDAFSVALRDDGGMTLGIHIADVAAFCGPGDPIDEEARRRGLTVYLPSGSTTMVPERLSCELASLVAGEDRPAVSLFLEVDAASTIESIRLVRSVIRVDHRLHYDEVDELLAVAPDTAMTEALARIGALAEARRRERHARGAIVLERRELVVKVRDGRVEVGTIFPGSPSHVLVAEMMILYNEQAARHARDRGIPIIYRGQDAPDQELPTIELGAPYDPVVADDLFRRLKPSRLSLEPLAHSSLGLELYTQASSPLRRYADLVIQRQLVARLAGEEPPHGAAELLTVLAEVDGLSRERAVLERKAKQFHVLDRLNDERHVRFHGVVVRADGPGPQVELEEWPIRGWLVGEAEVEPGTRLSLEVESIDGRRERLRVRRAAL